MQLLKHLATILAVTVVVAGMAVSLQWVLFGLVLLLIIETTGRTLTALARAALSRLRASGD